MEPLECFLLAPLYLVYLSASRQLLGVAVGSVKNNIFGISGNKDEGTVVCNVVIKNIERKDEGESGFLVVLHSELNVELIQGAEVLETCFRKSANLQLGCWMEAKLAYTSSRKSCRCLNKQTY